MKLATIRTNRGTRAARLTADGYVELDYADVGELLAHDDWPSRATADGDVHPTRGADLAPVVTRPGKVLCVGLNYRTHILASRGCCATSCSGSAMLPTTSTSTGSTASDHVS
ncbi:MAG: hypothetical protein GEV04_19890 [Actinophytocola sp.]|nr:hypothetical protein [Actinophytocola sp.]